MQNKDFDIKKINDSSFRRSSLIIKPKKPKYWLNPTHKNKNNNIDNIENNSKSFIESKSIKNKLDKNNYKLQRKKGTLSSINLKKTNIKNDFLNINNEKKDEGFIQNLGKSINQFEDIKSEDLIDIYYF